MKVPPYPHGFPEMHAPAGIDLSEILLELIDALSHPLCDSVPTDLHVGIVRAASEVVEHHDPKLSSILLIAGSLLNSRPQLNEAEVALSGPPAGWTSVIEDLKAKRAELAGVDYVFHGTILGRVRSIAEHGLMPGREPVWSKRGLAKWSAQAVFFASTWRAASDWASMAHEHSRGPRDGMHRKPVVVRVPTIDLTLEPDIVTTRPDSLMVRNLVATDNADVLLIGYRTLPVWRPIWSVK